MLTDHCEILFSAVTYSYFYCVASVLLCIAVNCFVLFYFVYIFYFVYSLLLQIFVKFECMIGLYPEAK